ncbi:MAG TPA: hypothetical protein VMB26_15145 [Candidatus Binataceae bacterium]|nr:hypothetical protein [Candidatus Binataceae bacterium]
MSSKDAGVLQTIDQVLLQLIDQQERKVLELGLRIHPGLTPEDIRNPQDFPDLLESYQWNFEDGILAGLKSAHMALRAKLLESG